MSLYRAARGALRNPLDKHEEAQWPKEARAGRARGKRRSAKARRPKARSTKTSRWPSRNDTWTRAVRAGKMQLAVVRVIDPSWATYTERKGVVSSLSRGRLSSTGRRADNSRCGANATAAIDDALLRFLELALSPLPFPPSPPSFHLSFRCLGSSPLPSFA